MEKSVTLFYCGEQFCSLLHRPDNKKQKKHSYNLSTYNSRQFYITHQITCTIYIQAVFKMKTFEKHEINVCKLLLFFFRSLYISLGTSLMTTNLWVWLNFIGQKVPKCYISLVCLYLAVYCHPKVLISMD